MDDDVIRKMCDIRDSLFALAHSEHRDQSYTLYSIFSERANEIDQDLRQASPELSVWYDPPRGSRYE